MKIVMTADHAAAALLEELRAHLQGKYEIIGAPPAPPSEYPEVAAAAARSIAAGHAQLGILLCGTGAGVSIAAGKIRGIRAATCSEPYTAEMMRRHNNAQILCMGARVVGTELAKTIADAFLSATFEGGRHAERIDRIAQLEV